jgi:hypothetical protein
MAIPKRFIKSQGDFDSACFLYSIVNAVQCLSGRKITGADWRRLISYINDPRDFLTFNTGTERTDNRPQFLAELITDYMSTLDPKENYAVKLVEGLDSSANFETLLKKKALLLVDNGKHWFCLIDSHDNQAYAACSAIWQNNPGKYRELPSPRLARTYNDSFKVADLEFLQNRAFLITVK